MRFAWSVLFCCGLSSAALAQGTISDYERAARMQSAHTLVSRTSLNPNWIGQGDQFWYLDEHAGVKTFLRVDPARGTQRPAFDHARLAASISTASKAYSANDLPFDSIEFRDNDSSIAFMLDDVSWRCDLSAYRCALQQQPVGAKAGEVLSPDGRWAVFIRDHNLWSRDTRTNEERALTRDGEPRNDYGSDSGISLTPVTDALRKNPPEIEVVFSPDSTRLLTYRIDARAVTELAMLQTVPEARPRLHRFPYPMPGDAGVPKVKMVLVDLHSAQVQPLSLDPFVRMTSFPLQMGWNERGTQVYFLEETRGFKSARLHVADAGSAQVRTALEERSDTYINRNSQLRMIGNDLLWTSERDGWNHLYLIDGRSGVIKKQLTRGNWAVRDIHYIDAKRGQIYFTAGGVEAGQDPYLRFLYRVGVDGSTPKLLTPEAADHGITFAPNGRYFVDTYSRIDLAPVTVLRAADGRLVRKLQEADLAPLLATGWRLPEPFTVKASDGQTDLYGMILRPSNFDPKRRYPVLDAIYPGPQHIRTPKTFSLEGSAHREDDLALAELGFIVVTVDGRGTPWRSRAFREYAYGNMGAAGALEDHVAALKALAERYSFIDLERVGIYGHSGGGYASARAMLKYPEFYKVAVSSAGNHDQRSYWAEWGERFQGYPVGDSYLNQANAALASRLKGRLLLVHGDLDDNVHVSNMLQLADALIAANKDFDMLILPNRNHGLVDLGNPKASAESYDPYFLRRRWDYFVQNLMGVTPPGEFALKLQTH
jgi:dipeptidyl aminopeptidase/acylaminoacyl peptidase